MHFDPIGFALLMLLGLGAALVGLVGYTLRALTRPVRRTFASALARGKPADPSQIAPGDGGARAFTSWTFRSRGRELPVWDLAGDCPEGPVVVMSHGWGDSRIGALSRAPALLPLASRVVMWDMPGHGEAPGSCTLGVREVEDLVELIGRVGHEHGIVLFGWSLGAGVSIAAAARAPGGIVGVVAEAPYRVPVTPARNVLAGFALPHRLNLAPALWLVALDAGTGPRFPGFDRAALAAGLRCPLLVVHGEEDEICPIGDGRAIAAGARDGRIVVVPRAGHHGLWTEARSRRVCEAALREFVAALLPYDPERCTGARQSMA